MGNVDFFGREGSRPEIREMANDDGESGDLQQARTWHARRVSSFSSEEASPAGGSCAQSSSVFSAIESSTQSGDGMGVILDPCSPQDVFFCASVARALSSRHPFASESRHKRATLEKGAPNTLREGGFCFASADTLKGSGGRVVARSSNTSREGGSRFFFSLLLTRRGSVEEKGWSRSNTSGEVGSRFPFTPFSSVRGESKYSLVAGGQRDNRIELAKTTDGSSVSEETSNSHAHDDVTHAVTMTRTGLRSGGRMRHPDYEQEKKAH